MSLHCLSVDDDEEIRQGDIIRCLPAKAESEVAWGMILTADCDIANNKMGDSYTWLQIIPSQVYLERFWAVKQLEKLGEKQSKAVVEQLNALIKKIGYDLNPLTPKTLCDWLCYRTSHEILSNIVGNNDGIDQKLLSQLEVVRLCYFPDPKEGNLSTLRKVWNLLGKDIRNLQAALRQAFDSNNGFSDFILVPQLPGEPHYGFVILLRAISSLTVEDLFKSEIDAKVSDRPYAFHRIGRFNDALRFSVSQKLAFLFSRIGMTIDYEDDCELVTELLVESISTV